MAVVDRVRQEVGYAKEEKKFNNDMLRHQNNQHMAKASMIK